MMTNPAREETKTMKYIRLAADEFQLAREEWLVVAGAVPLAFGDEPPMVTGLFELVEALLC
jgi:hypothetical protein